MEKGFNSYRKIVRSRSIIVDATFDSDQSVFNSSGIKERSKILRKAIYGVENWKEPMPKKIVLICLKKLLIVKVEKLA
jgi:hypothetical protein